MSLAKFAKINVRKHLCSQKFIFAKYNVLIGISQHFPLGTKITFSRFKIKCFLWFWTSGDFFWQGDFRGTTFSCHRCRQFAPLPPVSSYTRGGLLPLFLVWSSCGRLLIFGGRSKHKNKARLKISVKSPLSEQSPYVKAISSPENFSSRLGGFRRGKQDFKSLLGGEESLPDEGRFSGGVFLWLAWIWKLPKSPLPRLKIPKSPLLGKRITFRRVEFRQGRGEGKSPFFGAWDFWERGWFFCRFFGKRSLASFPRGSFCERGEIFGSGGDRLGVLKKVPRMGLNWCFNAS